MATISALFICPAVLLTLIASTTAHTAPEPTVSLEEAFRTAVARTETMPIQAARIDQVEAQVSQQRGRLLPQIALTANYLRQDTSANGDGSEVARNFTRPDQITSRVTLLQPIFRGGREKNGLNVANLRLEAAEQFAASARLMLFSQVARAFYAVLNAESEKMTLDESLELTAKRIDELQGRAKIGRSRAGEVLSAQSQRAILLSEIETTRVRLRIAREQLAVLTGLPQDTLLKAVDSSTEIKLPEIETLLKQAESHPDLKAFSSQRDASEEGVAVARSGHWPSVDLLGNYYLKRTGVLEGSKWDLGLSLTIPIFQGGIVQGQVREASAVNREAELLLMQLRREVANEIQRNFRTLSGGLKQSEALQEAVKLAEGNYQQQARDYRFGLVTNLDVLQALNTLQETRRSFNRVRYDTLSAHAALQAAAGTLPIEN